MLEVRPSETVDVPKSDGYILHGSLLNILSRGDEEVAEHIHDSDVGGIRNSGLMGEFAESSHRYKKRLEADGEYYVSVGIFAREGVDAYEALMEPLTSDGEPLPLEENPLGVTGVSSETTTCSELVEKAAESDADGVVFDFRTPTCLDAGSDVSTMFPVRHEVLRSAEGKWRATAPDELDIALGTDEYRESLIEKPRYRSYDSESVVVYRTDNGDGSSTPIMQQGFTGACRYDFKQASDEVENAILALALFSEYSGIGSAVARGCGTVEVELI